MTKAAAPAATSALVRVPAMRCRHCRSKPIVAPNAIASNKRMANCSVPIRILSFSILLIWKKEGDC